MIPLQERYETGFDDIRKDSKEPSTAEILEWSEQWAYQLQLWGDLDPESSMNCTIDDSTSDVTLNIAESIQQEQDVAELHNSNFRSVQNHPHKRKEANQFVDNLLRNAGIPDNNLSQYGEVLPYKIAQLHRIKSPRPVAHKIPVWLYKKNINADRFRSASKDLHCFLVEARTSLEDLQQQLHQAANSSLPIQTEWEYSLLEGAHTKRSSSNSGVLKRLSDWRNVSRRILSPRNLYHAMIVFQRFDMHKPYQPLPTLNECQDIGMSRVNQLIKNAQNTQAHFSNPQDPFAVHVLHQNGLSPSSHSSTACPISNEPNPFDSEQVQQPDYMMPVSTNGCNAETQPTFSFPSSQTLQQSVESEQGTDPYKLRSTTYKNGSQDEHDSWPLSNDESALSRYLTVWLEHDGTVNQQVNCPQYDASKSRLRNHRDKPEDTWYFQQET